MQFELCLNYKKNKIGLLKWFMLNDSRIAGLSQVNPCFLFSLNYYFCTTLIRLAKKIGSTIL